MKCNRLILLFDCESRNKTQHSVVRATSLLMQAVKCISCCASKGCTTQYEIYRLQKRICGPAECVCVWGGGRLTPAGTV